MVTFGSKAGSNIRTDLKNSTGGGTFLKTLQDGKDLRVRFLQNPEDFYSFREHYSQATKFFPCTQDDTCPGCMSDNDALKRTSKRYAASVLDVGQGKVIPLKMPLDLANRVTNKCDRNSGTLLDRDFTLIRTGKGMDDTTYDVEAEDKSVVDISRYELINIEKILGESFAETFGMGQVPEAPKVNREETVEELQAKLEAMRQKQMQESETPKVVESGPVSLHGVDQTLGDEKSQKEPVQTPESGADTADDFLSLEALNSMTHTQLLMLCTENKLKPPEEAVASQETLLAWLLAEFGV